MRIDVFGNCQARGVARALAGMTDADVAFSWLQSPDAFGVYPDAGTGPELHAVLQAEGLPLKYARGGVDHPWTPPLMAGSPLPDVFVFTMFPEPGNLFRAPDGNLVYLNPEALAVSPGLRRWVRENLAPYHTAAADYLLRFADMLRDAARLNPGAPLVVVGRSRPAPAYAPAPHCLLADWDDLSRGHEERLRLLAREVPGLLFVDADRVVLDACARQGESIDRFYPCLRFLGPGHGEPSRDLEHAPDALWREVALAAARMLNGGAAPGHGRDLEAFLARPWRPGLPDDVLPRLLDSPCRFDQARALAQMILDEDDHAALLAAAAPTLLAHKHVLILLKAYARAKPDAALLPVYDVLKSRALKEYGASGNGFWFRKFLEELVRFRALALGGDEPARDDAMTPPVDMRAPSHACGKP